MTNNHDSSALNSPDLTRLSGEQAEERTAREPMTKHTDSSRSSDSGVSGNAQTSESEIRVAVLGNADESVVSALKTQAMIDYAKHWSQQQLAEVCQCGEIRSHHAFGSGLLCRDPDKCMKFEKEKP